MNILNTDKLVVVLAEKPSVAKDIMTALQEIKFIKKEGYFQAGNLIITYAIGHLYQIDDSIVPQKWSLEDLPIFPEKFEYKPVEKTKKQAEVVKELIKKADIVINACDSGREGELIARLILLKSGFKGELKRLWTSEALTREVVRRELSNLKDGSQYDSLFYSAIARQHADWITGINLTRLVTVKVNDRSVWSVGRVQTPVLKLIVDRYKENKNFKPETYYVIKGDFSKSEINYSGVLNNRFSKYDAENILSILKEEKKGEIISIEDKERKQYPPVLHSLTSLQREANNLYGTTASTTLSVAQKLYEEYKCISYPRTDSNYMPESSKGLVISVLKKIDKEELIKNVNKAGKRVFDDSKLTDHHAIIILDKLPEKASDLEKKIYWLVYRRFVGAFMEPFVYGEVKIETSVKSFTFITTQKYQIMSEKEFESSFISLYKDEYKKEEYSNQGIRNLKKGDKITVKKIYSEEKQTTPPEIFTESSLLKVMETLGLGTPATRASIIENLKKREYIYTKGKLLIPSQKGIELSEKLENSMISQPEMTATWEKRLEEIYTQNKGKEGYKAFIAEIKRFVSDEIKKLISTSIESKKDITGKCKCGGKIIRHKKVFKCDTCGNFVYNTIYGKRITEKQAEKLINGEKVKMIGLKNKQGKKFNAVVFSEGGKISLSFDFEK